MNLTLIKVSAVNLKGLTFELALEKATLLVGPNYVGKTARADAIRLLLTGFLPELGKLNSSTFGLSSGKDMRVSGTLRDENGRELPISRRWYLKGDSIKCEEDVPPALAGAPVEVMLNAASWFDLTENERIEWVYKNASTSTDKSRESVLEAARVNVRITIAEEGIKAEEKQIDAFFDKLSKAISCVENEDGIKDVPEFVEVASNVAADFQRESKAQASVAEKGIQNLAALRASDEKPVDSKAIEAEIAEKRAALDKLKEERARIVAEANAALGRRNRRETLKKELASLPTHEESLRANEAKLEDLKAKLAALPAATQDDVDDLAKEENDALSAAAFAGKDLTDLSKEATRIEHEKLDIDSKDACPYCGAVGEGWKDLRLGELDRASSGLEAKRVDLLDRKAKAQETAAAAAARKAAKQRALYDRSAVENEIRRAESAVATAKLAIAVFAGKREELASMPEEIRDSAPLTTEIDGKIKAEQSVLLDLDQRLKAALGRANDLLRLAQAEKARDEAKVDAKVAAAAVDALKAIKRTMVEQAFEPIIIAANAFAGRLLRSPLAFNVLKGEVGTWRGGAWIGHKTFSGVERLLTYAAIQAAFASRSAVKVMILDEMLRAADTESRKAFSDLLTACERAVETGFVDTLVGIIPGDARDYAHLAKPEIGLTVVGIS